MNQCEESFFHQKLSVEDDQFGAGRYEIVTFVELEELDKNLILVIYGNSIKNYFTIQQQPTVKTVALIFPLLIRHDGFFNNLQVAPPSRKVQVRIPSPQKDARV
jgi:hypothetical protein